ncbi:MAG: SET domain-containing protein-lysine N-methyltransferase [Acidobacteria bacterium]|nr:SET domain-containing protein-lysine N-methyltransferase [Acidobacteriota bacterium]
MLQPSYEGSACDYRHYDPPRDLSQILPEHTYHHEFLNKVSTFSQIKSLAGRGFGIFVNLCEGYLDSDVPSIDVIHALEHLNLPFTGPTSALYDPPKDLMKLVALSSGVNVPAWVLVRSAADLPAAGRLRYPLFVKPAAYGDSMGIDEGSLVTTAAALELQVGAKLPEFGSLLVEEYVDGREFTVLLHGTPDPAERPVALTPLEFLFPPGPHFKTYALKVTQFHPECNVLCTDPDLTRRLKDAALQVFTGFSGTGYARMDFRVAPDGGAYFLEANFACSVFYPDGYQGSADYILQFDGIGQAGFLHAIIAEGLARHARRQSPYSVKHCGDSFAMFAARDLPAGSTVFAGEGKAQRIVSRAHVERTWSPADREVFYRYAYPISPDVFVLWDTEPTGWAPQNHSCDPNTAFAGLNLVALRNIRAGEELTVDYATFYDRHMIPFDCTCGSAVCRGRVIGGPGLFGNARTPEAAADPGV